MKLRIPRRIKVEDDSSDSENEPITSTSSGNFTNAQNNIENEIEKDKVLSFVTSDTGYNGGLSVISGAPTRTTSTLTPTTLRNIEQTFQDLTNDLSQSTPYQAGFVPPLPAPITNQDQYVVPAYQQSQAMIPSFLTEEANNSIESLETSSMSDSSWHTPPPSMMDDVKGSSYGKGRPRTNYASSSASTQSNEKPRRNVGGRKPNKPSNISPEEEEKRKVRRERNKQAAARCRRRREDHTHELQKQVDAMEDKKRQLTTEIQQMNKMRDELCELIDEHKRSTGCIIGDRESPADVKPNLNGKIENVLEKFTSKPSTTMSIQRPANFTNSFSNNNNNNTMNANSKLSLKIKAEPLDLYDDEPPIKKRCEMLSGQEYDITTPTTPYMPQLNTPTFIPNKQSLINKPNRPSSLNVPANLKPSEALQRKNVTDLAGINVCTPSTGMFNFESLMEGGTGLTPVSNPLIPCSTQNRNPLEMLNTPTSGSEPSKLVSL
ncbi:unnamed protein product [Chironomus riparius]|uniref:BZIP domain-containing protein n=1 Tax=Chironomus riparius TaxID=315576 RepID=A0A9N9S826_9DIPT|nr:unnamed protein product [Chironomus riparius]